MRAAVPHSLRLGLGRSPACATCNAHSHSLSRFQDFSQEEAKVFESEEMARPLVLCSLCFLLFNFLWMRRTLECGGHHRLCHGNRVDSYRFLHSSSSILTGLDVNPRGLTPFMTPFIHRRSHALQNRPPGARHGGGVSHMRLSNYPDFFVFQKSKATRTRYRLLRIF
jgi:hypothetical protein